MATSSGRIEVVDLLDRSTTFTIPGAGEQIRDLYLSSAANLLMVCEDNRMVIYALDGTGTKETITASPPFHLSEDGRLLAFTQTRESSPKSGFDVVVRDLVKKSELLRIAIDDLITCLRIVPDWNLILAGNERGQVTSYSLKSGMRKWRLKPPLNAAANHLMTRGAAADGQIFVAHEDRIAEWQTGDFHSKSIHRAPGRITNLRRTPLGESIWFTASGSVWRLDSATPELNLTPAGHATSLGDFEVAPGNEFFIVAVGNSTAGLYSIVSEPKTMSQESSPTTVSKATID